MLEVGQIRSSSGTSINRMMKADILQRKGARSVTRTEVAEGAQGRVRESAYMAMMLTMPCQIPRVKVAVMMLDNPSAKQRIMDRMPSLPGGSHVSVPARDMAPCGIDAAESRLKSSRRTLELGWS